jgi:hypothetical protein
MNRMRWMALLGTVSLGIGALSLAAGLGASAQPIGKVLPASPCAAAKDAGPNAGWVCMGPARPEGKS